MRRTVLRILLVVTGAVIGLLLCEIGMRAFQLGNTRTTLLFNNRIYKLPPHVRFMNYYENKNLVDTNNLGFHDYDRAASNEKYRILFLGDSLLEGLQVKTENLFTSRLENMLSDGGRKIEIINGGVSGSGTAYQFVLWKEFFEPRIKVDHVVLCFYLGNDITDNNANLRLATSSGNGSDVFVDEQGNILEGTKKPGAFKQIINYFRDHSVVANASYESAYRIGTNLQTDTTESLQKQGYRGDSGNWEASELGTIRLIERWKRELVGKNTPFDIVIIDRPAKVYNKFELKFLEKLQASCAEDRTDCLRLKLEGDPFDFYSFDGVTLGHLNEKGHETVAKELYDYFQSHHQTMFNR